MNKREQGRSSPEEEYEALPEEGTVADLVDEMKRYYGKIDNPPREVMGYIKVKGRLETWIVGIKRGGGIYLGPVDYFSPGGEKLSFCYLRGTDEEVSDLIFPKNEIRWKFNPPSSEQSSQRKGKVK